ARAAGHGMIRLADVDRALQSFLPHRLNEYEDCIYFPRLPRGERVTIEAYDLDSFRDGGLHWFYLQEAIRAPGYSGRLEPDPFAAELLVEGAAQFGTLVLRMAGIVAREAGDPRLKTAHLEAALKRIQRLIDRHAAAPPETAEGDLLVSSAEPPAAAASKYFTDVTASSGFDFQHRMADWLARLIRSYVQERDGVAKLAVPQAFGGSGVAAEDLDGDGDFDLVALSGAGNALFANDGRGRFTDVTAGAGIAWVRPDGRPGEPRQPIVADLDNDGRQDILITYANDDHRLYRNLGGLRFADVTAEAGLGGAGSVGGPATAFDFDADGLLDVFIGYFGDYIQGVLPTLARRNNNGLPDRLFRNLGGLRFADVTAASGLADSGWTQAAGHTDFDRDGRQDLIVGNDFGANAYYRNLGGGRFEEVSARLGTDKPSFTMNIGLTDLNRDGFPDIYISNIVTMNKDEKYVLPDETTPMKLDPAKLATMRIVEANDLFTSVAADGRLQGYRLSDAVGRSGAAATGWAWDADFFDFDNDGDDDLYCVNGMNEYAVYSSYNPYFTDPGGKPLDVVIPVADKETHVFFVNRGGRLENDSARSGADLLGNSRSVAYLDADADGDLDMALNNFQSPAVLLRNESQARGNHWLKVRLVGDPARGVSRDAIGARIEVETASHQRLSREVLSTTGYLSVHPKQQHLGLGRDTRARLAVLWPNGERQDFDGLAADRAYTIVQGKGITTDAAPRP
ncbi:MAG: CRTAC1 family protein, partial [Chloroflexi bacterium]|nr:CRTAC1 family protein [Chloroflexota bacterium]